MMGDRLLQRDKERLYRLAGLGALTKRGIFAYSIGSNVTRQEIDSNDGQTPRDQMMEE